MFESVISPIAGFITAFISHTGYVGVAILMAIESACVPVPSEVVMPFAGSLVPAGRFTLVGVATAGAVGCNLGSTLAYAVGACGGRRAVERWGRYVLLTPADIDWGERFFRRFGPAAVFLTRLMPVVRTFVALPAGVARMPMLRFQVYTFAGSWLWCLALAYVGARLGAAWNTDPTLKGLFPRFDVALVAVGAFTIAAFAWHRLRGTRTGPAGT